ncbi:hypothetical protein ACS0TY_002239 [Phlomoides rotata]
MRFGLQTAREYGLRGLDLETDSQNLVRALRGNFLTDAYSRLIVGDILSMARDIGGSEFQFVCQEANKVAHSLAHFGIGREFEETWVNCAPTCCNSLVAYDVRQSPTLI